MVGDEIKIECTINSISGDQITIIPAEMIIDPGYDPEELATAPEAEHGEKANLDYVNEALEVIKQKNTAMYDAVINGRQVDIILTDSKDPKFKGIKEREGTPYGVATYSPDRDARLFVDPSQIQFATSGKYEGCPLNVEDLPLNLRISGDEYAEIKLAINKTNELFVPAVVYKIKSSYEERGTELENFCLIGNETDIEEALEMLDSMSQKNLLAYIPSNTELSSLISQSDYATIHLAVDVLNDCRKWAYVEPPGSTIQLGGPSNVVDKWYPENQYNNGIPPSPKRVDELRVKQYTKTLAHEIKHIQNSLDNPILMTKWSLIRGLPTAVFDLNKCYPHPKNGYCSNAEGHEHLNQDGLDTCSEEGNYPNPYYKIQ